MKSSVSNEFKSGVIISTNLFFFGLGTAMVATIISGGSFSELNGALKIALILFVTTMLLSGISAASSLNKVLRGSSEILHKIDIDWLYISLEVAVFGVFVWLYGSVSREDFSLIFLGTTVVALIAIFTDAIKSFVTKALAWITLGRI